MRNEIIYKLIHYYIKYNIELKCLYMKININNFDHIKLEYNMYLILDRDTLKYIWKNGQVYYIRKITKDLKKLYNKLEKQCMLIDC